MICNFESGHRFSNQILEKPIKFEKQISLKTSMEIFRFDSKEELLEFVSNRANFVDLSDEAGHSFDLLKFKTKNW